MQSSGGSSTPSVFDFVGSVEEDLIEVEVDDSLPLEEDDDASVFSEMEQSVGDGINEDDGPDMSHAVMTGHSDCVYVSAIHPTRADIVITGGGDDKAYIWTYDTSTENVGVYTTTEARVITCIELNGHTDTVSSVGFNFDGTMVLTGSYDGTVRTWDSITGELKLVMDGPEDIEWAQWHTKGNAIVAGSKDGTIWMWLAHDGQCVQVFAGHDGGVSSGCFTSDGKLICSGGEDGTVRVWAPKTGACKHVFDKQLGHESLVTCVESSPVDPDLILTGTYIIYIIIIMN
jgi:angio-associated migratory cell protein